MTNDEFRAWREHHFATRHAAAVALGLHRDTIDALETGTTRNGTAFPVRPYIALACLAVDHGLSDIGNPSNRGRYLADALRRAADLIEE